MPEDEPRNEEGASGGDGGGGGSGAGALLTGRKPGPTVERSKWSLRRARTR